MITDEQLALLQHASSTIHTPPDTAGADVLHRMADLLEQVGIPCQSSEDRLEVLGYRMEVEKYAPEQGPDATWANPPLVLRRDGSGPPVFLLMRDVADRKWAVEDPVHTLLSELILAVRGQLL
jgi:hypothetical protein